MLTRRSLLRLSAPAIVMSKVAWAGSFRASIDQRIIDLYHRDQTPRATETYNLSGRTQLSTALVPGQSTCVLISIGQSTSNNSLMTLAGYLGPGPNVQDPDAIYVPTNGTAVQNLSIGNRGAIFNCVDPLLGGELIQSNYVPRLADKLINGGTYQRVICATIAIGGSFAADWCPGGGGVGTVNAPVPNPVTGVLAYRIGLTSRCLANIGYLNNPNVKILVLWQQGEWDSDGTIGGTGTSQAQYTAALNGVIREFRNWGISGTFLVAQCTRPDSANVTTIRAAQAAVVDNPSGIYAGPNIDSIGSTTANRYDSTHFIAAAIGSDLGSDQQANLWQAAILAAPH